MPPIHHLFDLLAAGPLRLEVSRSLAMAVLIALWIWRRRSDR